MKYIVAHNGYSLEFFNSLDDCKKWVSDKVDELRQLHGMRLDFISTMESKDGNMCFIYQYRTLYCEVFTIINN